MKHYQNKVDIELSPFSLTTNVDENGGVKVVFSGLTGKTEETRKHQKQSGTFESTQKGGFEIGSYEMEVGPQGFNIPLSLSVQIWEDNSSHKTPSEEE